MAREDNERDLTVVPAIAVVLRSVLPFEDAAEHLSPQTVVGALDSNSDGPCPSFRSFGTRKIRSCAISAGCTGRHAIRRRPRGRKSTPLVESASVQLSLTRLEDRRLLHADARFAITPVDAYKPEGQAGYTQFLFEVERTGDYHGPTTLVYGVNGRGDAPADAADFGGSFPSGELNFGSARHTETGLGERAR